METFRSFRIRNKTLLPIVQGGMGIGVSARRLAGAVAREGGVGTIASVALRHHHPDLLKRSSGRHNPQAVTEANLEALDREVRGALQIAGGRGLVAVNVMRALEDWKGLVGQACQSGAHAIVMGAGLPLDLFTVTAEYPDVALVPILSDAQGVRIVLKKWKRARRRPDAIVIEHPKFAGGHLGATSLGDVRDAKFDFATVLPKIFRVFDELSIPQGEIPIIVAGGINSPEKIREVMALGASAVQIGTPFAVTTEGDAHENFKRVLLEAEPHDIVEFMSTAGLPARAVLTPWLRTYLKNEVRIRAAKITRGDACVRGISCLTHCGLRDKGETTAGRFCIERLLALALHGDVKRGLFFRGSEPVPFKDIRPVSDLLDYLLIRKVP